MKLAAAVTAMAVAVFLAAVTAGEPAGKGPAAAPGPSKPAGPELKVSEPAVHENLAVYFIHGPDRIKGTEFLTLKEALEKKVLIIRETGDVRELTVENKGEAPVYIQSGQLIKGGQQDRMLQYDCIVPAKSGAKPISSFCVESGRWSQRGGEDVGKFTSNNDFAVSNSMRLAAKVEADQGKVWSEVAKSQDKLSDNVGESVKDKRSESSLQLSLENRKLKEMVAAYVKRLERLPEGSKDVVGIAVAINGKVSSVDVYASHALFAKLWPGLLEAGSTEAVAELKKDAKFTAPTPADVRGFMAEAEKAAASEKKTADNMKMMVRDSGRVNASISVQSSGEEIHRSYQSKEQKKE